MKRVIRTDCCVYTNEIDAFLMASKPVAHKSITKYVEDRRTINFEVTRAEFGLLREIIEEFDIASRHRISQGEDGFVTYHEICEFSEKEIEEAELFVVIDRAKPCDRDEWEYPVEFDYSRSGTTELPLPWGWQVGPLRIKKSDLPNQRRPLWDTLHFEWGVSLAFREAAVQSSFASDIGFRVVTNPKGKPYEDVFQLTGKHQLPKYDPETTGLAPSRIVTIQDREFCLEGGGLLEEGFYPVMDRVCVLDSFGSIPEWSFSHCLIGGFDFVDDKREETGPTPRPVVGQTARRLLRSLGGKKLEFVPITWLSERKL